MTQIQSVADLVQNVSAPFEEARAMPPGVYTDPAFLELEIRNVFAREWFCVGRSDALANPGDYVTCELAGQPLAVIRDRDGGLRALSNVCLHRMSILLQGSGNKKVISCPYHGWSYNLDGSLRGAPAMNGNRGFCKGAYRLPEFRCEEWLGWIMVTLNRDATPVSEQLAGVEGLIADFGMEHYAQTFCEFHEWNTNWKVLAENFMESYHLPVCHAGTIGGLTRWDEAICPPGQQAFNYHTILKDEDFRLSVAHPDNTRIKGERRRMTFLLAIYPSLMITLTPGYFWYLSLHPRGVGRVRIMYGGGMAPEFVDSPQAQTDLAALKELLDTVNEEDRGCTERVYKGLCAKTACAGHLSSLERPNFEFACYLASRVGGFAPDASAASAG